jgi:tetratricopeptide (TPR) repeat protein
LAARAGELADAPTAAERSPPRDRDLAATVASGPRERRQDPAGGVATKVPRPRRRWLIAGLAAIAVLGALGALAMFAREDTRRPTAANEIGRDAGTSSQLAAERWAFARSAEQRGDLELAIASYQAAYAAEPAAEALYRIAELEERLGRASEAVRYFRRYLDAAPHADDREIVVARIAKLAPPMVDAGVTPPDAATVVAKATRPVPRKRCICLPGPSSPSPGYSLCTKITKPLCRCRYQGMHVCSQPMRCEPVECRAADGAKLLCDADPELGTFHVRAKPGEACAGYVSRTEAVTGEYECNMCPELPAFAYTGENGAPCKGFTRASGAPASGVLANCGYGD